VVKKAPLYKGLKTILPLGLMFQSRLIRRKIRRVRTLIHYRSLSLYGVPTLFANSFPKSGTHLMTQVLRGFSNLGPAIDSGLPAIVTYLGNTGQERTIQAILKDLDILLPGDIAYGHLHAIPEIVARLSQWGIAAYFILRDPRDVAVSHVYYIAEGQSHHIHHYYYTQMLHSFDERLKTSILGLPGVEVPFPDIGRRLEPFLGWLEQPAVLTLRYEEFLSRRFETLGRVFDHAIQRGFPADCSREIAIQQLAVNIDPLSSPTFRSGKSGEWQKSFNNEHKQVFKEVAGDLLIRLGYEKDNDW
jgi:hypothetical protein